MNPSRPFILRPIATSLLMAAILLIGIVGYRQLPIAALPEVDYPTMQVLTFYPGASADVVATAITAPLERQLGEVPGLNQMLSTSADGASVITLQFNLSLNIDVAEQDVQAAINAAQNYLPSQLPMPPVYNKVNPADAPILTLALTSDSMPLSQVEDYTDTRLAEKISQLPGVGAVTISGGQKPAVRVQVNPTQLASYGLNLEDVRSALTATSLDTAKGSFDGPAQSFQIGANDQITTAADFRDVVLAYRNGAPVMLRDVSNVIDGVENTELSAWMNKVPAVIVNIQRQPGANIINVVDSIKALLPKLRATIPPIIKIAVLTDRTTTVRASVADVEFELMLCVALVVAVIFVFLRTFAATVIPSVAVPLSLVGTFAAMYALGFSLNNLTLMALTISTGFVVDDAIVMIENITRYVEKGEPPLAAALKGAEQIGFTIMSLTVSLIAVLIPLLFMGDITGRLFREFAVTLSRDDPDLRVDLAHTHADAVCEAPEPQGQRRAEPLLPGLRAGVPTGHRLLRAHARLGARAPPADACRRREYAARDGAAALRGPQGFFPGAGHGRDPGGVGGGRRPCRSRRWPSSSSGSPP